MSEGIESGFSRMKSQVDDLIEKIVAKSSERIRTHITILVWKIICYRYCGSGTSLLMNEEFRDLGFSGGDLTRLGTIDVAGNNDENTRLIGNHMADLVENYIK